MFQEPTTKTQNAVELLKNTAAFCLDLQSIFDDLKKQIKAKELKVGKSFSERTTDFFTTKDDWLCWECYFEENGLIKIVFMLAAKGSSRFENDSSYCEMMNKLKADYKIPLLLFYGAFKPVNSTKADYSSWWCTYLRDSDTDEEWLNFDINNIEFEKEITITTQAWNQEHEEYGDYNEWFSSAKIKIKPILSIQNRRDIEAIAEELNKMMIE
jgi:hypothetical protein